MNTKNIEYDKPYASAMEIKNIETQHMKEIARDVDYGDRTIRVILQFPEEAQDAMAIKKSVKSILMMELEEQMKVSAMKNKDKS